MQALIVCALIVAARASYVAPAVGARFSYGFTAAAPAYARYGSYGVAPLAAGYAAPVAAGYAAPVAAAYAAPVAATYAAPVAATYAAPVAATYAAPAAAAYAVPVATAYAAPVATAYAAPVASSAQHHSQDELGQYNYGYADINSAKNEVKTADGVVRGSYSYVDAYGLPQKVDYVSDALGFRVAGTNLPVGPAGPGHVADTPEVAAAKSAHFAAHAEALARAAVH
ncbi:cuticle protein 7-like [Pollicipes pollicipes]|uniref:cuticle protein 7-like n=1 Tax=Pollicipes pollicipes TaxID=41117 RepID=UPI001884E53E|nr:cuticle protein 7-like [Pollicipes pollicipes]